jgi:hypothetical protein
VVNNNNIKINKDSIMS